MSDGWIKCLKRLWDTTEIATICLELGINRHEAVGRVLHVWAWFDDHCDIDEPDTEATIKVCNARVTIAALQARDSCVTQTLRAMEIAGWLKIENDTILLPHFARHNGLTSKARALTSRRVARHRRLKRNDSVTLDALPEKRREDIYKKKKKESVSHTQCSVQFDADSRSWKGVSEDDLVAWRKAFPACSVETELAKAAEWVIANPTRTKRNWRRFLVNWLSRSQERGGTPHPTGSNDQESRVRMAKEIFGDG